ncbi:MAG: tRNA (N6-isopentenyl adenosine(37)-C2)-methylthiotransferase MiaB, partial [candidate division WOR-3 bacterium]
MSKKFYIKTFGCQMNKHDSSIITQILHDCGFEQTSDFRNAHIFIVNTCSVRKHAEQRALSYIAGLRRWSNTQGKIV